MVKIMEPIMGSIMVTLNNPIIASVTFNTRKKASSNPKPNSPADSDGVSSNDSDNEPGDGDPNGDPDNEPGDGDPDGDPNDKLGGGDLDSNSDSNNELGGGDLDSDSDSNNELGDGDPNLPCADKLALPLCYDGQGKFKPKQWATAIIECNPLNCA